ncbi:hypothetical protein G6F58_012350 [Rhizopus delemar]|nr:hypothetical protein G6F58_012350 [Rhizopus delemar]
MGTQQQLSKPTKSEPQQQQQPVQQQCIPTIIQDKNDSSHYTIPTDGIAPGGRLQQFYHNWTKITSHHWPLSVVKDGFRIQFHQQPTPWKLKPLRLTIEDQYAVDEAVQKFLNAQIIELSPSQHTGFLSNFFTIQETNKRRPILDCQMINRFIQCQHFKMEGVPALRDLIEEKDYICKQGVSIQDIGFRDECQSSNIQQTNAVRYGAYENARDPTSVLPRRHMHFGEDTDGSSEAHNGRNITFRKPGKTFWGLHSIRRK